LTAFVIGFLGVFAAQVVKGTVGFGGALVAMPVLTVVFGPAEAIFLSGCCDVVSGFVLLPSAWRVLRWRLMALLLVPMMVGQFFAADFVPYIPVDVFMIALGLLVFVLGASFAWRPVRTGRGELDDLPDRDAGKALSWAVVGGLGAGIMSGLFGTPGPPVVIYFKRFFRDAFIRAHLIALFFPGAAALVAIMTFKQTVSDPGGLAQLALGFIPAIVAGGLIGSWMSPRLSRKTFGRFVGVILAIAGLTLAIAGL